MQARRSTLNAAEARADHDPSERRILNHGRAAIVVRVRSRSTRTAKPGNQLNRAGSSRHDANRGAPAKVERPHGHARTRQVVGAKNVLHRPERTDDDPTIRIPRSVPQP
jgi:hypothetical protein